MNGGPPAARDPLFTGRGLPDPDQYYFVRVPSELAQVLQSSASFQIPSHTPGCTPRRGMAGSQGPEAASNPPPGRVHLPRRHMLYWGKSAAGLTPRAGSSDGRPPPIGEGPGRFEHGGRQLFRDSGFLRQGESLSENRGLTLRSVCPGISPAHRRHITGASPAHQLNQGNQETGAC